MSEKFTIDWHPVERIMEAAPLGAWTVEDVDNFYGTMREKIGAEMAGGDVRILSDLTNYPVQQPAVADRHKELLARIGQNPAIAAVAWIVGGVIPTMQAERNVREAGAPVRTFGTRAEAWEFLVAH